MHILYFHQHFSTPKGATGTRSYEMAQALLREGHQVTMVCGSYGLGQTGLTQPFIKGRREGDVAGIHVVEFDLSYSNRDGFLKRSWQFAKFSVAGIGLVLRRDYDLCFATTTPLTAGIPGIAAKWLRRKPFVFEVRDLWPELPRAMGVISNPVVLKLMSALEWLSYRSADRLVGLSPGICEGIRARGVAPDRVVMVPNGCDLSLFSGAGLSWRPEGVEDTDLMAVFTGTHGQANGLDAVLDAAAELKSRGRDDIKFVLIGDGKLKPQLMARAQADGLTNVLFLDPVGKEKLAELMRGADIGLQVLADIPAFYFGTSPNKFFDYLSAGLPVLNNYPGWLAQEITAADCGYAVPPRDAAAFADALIAAAERPADLAAKGCNARALAETRFDRRRLSKTWVDWLTRVAAPK